MTDDLNLTQTSPSAERQAAGKKPAEKKLLIAASGTGGHLFPAIATAEVLTDWQIEWLGVPDRLETELVPDRYPLHKISVTGFQGRLGLNTLKTLARLIGSISKVRHLLRKGNFSAVFTTGGYIAAPAIIAARSLKLPTLLHESNAIPGKVTRLLSPLCSQVALGFAEASEYLPQTKTVWVGTPVRPQFCQDMAMPLPDLEIPPTVPLIVVVGGSQGAVTLNQLVRDCFPAWLEAGAWVVHLTGSNDPDAQSLRQTGYIALPFYNHMAPLLHRATLAVSRAGAGTLTELAATGTPAILIPYPHAAEDHQTANAKVFSNAGAAHLMPQATLTADRLKAEVLNLLQNPDRLATMAEKMHLQAKAGSAEQVAALISQISAEFTSSQQKH